MSTEDNKEKKHIGLEAMQEGQSYIETRKDEFVEKMRDVLAKNIRDTLKEKNITDLDNILIAALALVYDESIESVINKLSKKQSEFKSRGVDNIILTATFYNLDNEFLFGKNSDSENKDFPRRLDKVTKIIEIEDSETGIGAEKEVDFNLDWNNVNNWNWDEFIEPLNINYSGNQKIESLKSLLTLFPKVACTYTAIRAEAGTSTFDSQNSNLAFPFFEEQLDGITYTSVFDDTKTLSGRYHYGVDLAAEIGTPIHACAEGVVFYAWTAADGDAGGNRVAIKHANNIYTIYMHMREQKNAEGDIVKKGQVIGYVGNTGVSTGPHLHFQVNIGGVDKNTARNPIEFFQRLGAVPLGSTLGSVKD